MFRTAGSRTDDSIGLLILLALAVAHYTIIFYFSGNYFWYDDIIVAFHEIETTLNAPSLPKAIDILAGPYGDHRSMLSRLFFLTQIRSNDLVVNYQVLMLLGNIFTLGTVWLLSKVWRLQSWPWIHFVPVALLLFNVQYFEAQFFANGVFCYVAVIFFSIWLLYETATKQRLWLMMLLAVISLLTFGNALFALAAVFVQLALTRQWRKLGFWAVFCTIAVGLYFYNLKNPYSSGGSATPPISIINGLILTIQHIGSLLYYERIFSLAPAFLLGVVLLLVNATFLWRLLKKFLQQTTPTSLELMLAGIIVIGLLSGTAIGFLRGSQDTEYVFFPRYRFASILLTITAYIIVYQALLQYKYKAANWLTASFFALVYIPTLCIYLPVIKDFYNGRQVDSWMLKHHSSHLSSFSNPYDKSSRVNVVLASPSSVTTAIAAFDSTKALSAKFETLQKHSDNLVISYIMNPPDVSSLNKKSGYFLYFVNSNFNFIIPLKRPYAEWPSVLSNRRIFEKYLSGSVYRDKDELRAGKGLFKGYLLEQTANSFKWYKTNLTISL